MLEVITWLADKLRAAGISACIDPADLNTPGVWIAPNAESLDRLDSTRTVTVDVYLVTGSAGVVHELRSLDTLTAAARRVVNLPTVTALQLTLPNHHVSGLPAYHAQLELEVSES